MNRVIQTGVGLVLAVALFAVSIKYFHLQTWLSALLAGLALAITLLSQALDTAKKPLELTKLALETAKLRRDAKKEKEKENLVKLPTDEEVREFGASYTERKLRALYRLEEQRELLAIKSFIAEERDS